MSKDYICFESNIWCRWILGGQLRLLVGNYVITEGLHGSLPGSWRLVFGVASGVLVLTAVFFMSVGSGSVQHWNNLRDRQERQSQGSLAATDSRRSSGPRRSFPGDASGPHAAAIAALLAGRRSSLGDRRGSLQYRSSLEAVKEAEQTEIVYAAVMGKGGTCPPLEAVKEAEQTEHRVLLTVRVICLSTNNANVLGIGKVEYKGSEPAYSWRESGKPFRKNHLQSSEQESNLDIPVLGRLAQHKTSALTNYVMRLLEEFMDDHENLSLYLDHGLSQNSLLRKRTGSTSSRRTVISSETQTILEELTSPEGEADAAVITTVVVTRAQHHVLLPVRVIRLSTNYANVLEIEKVEYKGNEPAYSWRESGKPFRKNHLQSSERESNLDIPVLCSLAQHETSALTNYAMRLLEEFMDDHENLSVYLDHGLSQNSLLRKRTGSTSSRRTVISSETQTILEELTSPEGEADAAVITTVVVTRAQVERGGEQDEPMVEGRPRTEEQTKGGKKGINVQTAQL
uniref:(California timema) hypothetical protein n=1 Tax=Timema californicum TaxID=61474 RepID=A0A7R9JE80_TIMCA|nr:unnamed protein product [Timema californicum]